jgi:hypothetical protein
MVYRFAPPQPMGLIRRAMLIAVATIVLMLLWASVAISQSGKTYYEMGPDGMMRPDGTITQTNGGAGSRSRLPPPTYTYKATHQADGSFLITRNGANWITVAAKPGYFAITDPNGTGALLIKLDQSAVREGPSRSTR